MDQFQISSFSNYTIIQFFFSILGILFYFALIFLFKFYYNCLIFITEKIFTFILLNSLTSLITLFIEIPLKKYLFVYISGTIQFYLVISFINKCLTSDKFSKDSKNFEINYQIYIVLIYMICSFPFTKIFVTFEKNLFEQNAVKMILTVLLYEHIREKLYNILDYLDEKKLNTNEKDVYLPYMKAHYYHKIIKTINSIFFISFILFIILLIIKILDNLINYKLTFQYSSLFVNLLAIYFLIIGCILFFYPLNKSQLEKHKKGDKKESIDDLNSQKFRVIDVEITNTDGDGNMGVSYRKRKRNKNKDNNNYVKIGEEDNKGSDVCIKTEDEEKKEIEKNELIKAKDVEDDKDLKK